MGAAFAPLRRKNVPQRLKPLSKSDFYGTAEAVPLARRFGVAVSLVFWFATFCERGLGVRVVRRPQLRILVYVRKRPWRFRVGLVELWR